MRVYRVTVRGQFSELTEAARAYLVASASEHDIFVSSFTEEGTFTYDSALQFFNFRYELRLADDVPEQVALDTALVETELFLATMKIGFTGLRAAAMDMTAMTNR